MTMPPAVETTPPPACTCDDEDTPSSLIEVSVITPDETRVAASVHVFDDVAAGAPDRFADAVLSAALGCARTRGPDFAWALARTLDAYRAGQ